MAKEEQMEELKQKSLQDLLNEEGNSTISIVLKDTNVGGAPLGGLKKLVDYIAWFVGIFGFTLIGLDKSCMARLQEEDKKLAEIAKETDTDASETDVTVE
jgi:hypothetical protein